MSPLENPKHVFRLILNVYSICIRVRELESRFWITWSDYLKSRMNEEKKKHKNQQGFLYLIYKTADIQSCWSLAFHLNFWLINKFKILFVTIRLSIRVLHHSTWYYKSCSCSLNCLLLHCSTPTTNSILVCITSLCISWIIILVRFREIFNEITNSDAIAEWLVGRRKILSHNRGACFILFFLFFLFLSQKLRKDRHVTPPRRRRRHRKFESKIRVFWLGGCTRRKENVFFMDALPVDK